jgi:PKD repeat protein
MVIKTGTGKFRVSATHTYAEAGTYSAIVTVTDTGGASAHASTTINVADAKLSGSAVAVKALKSQLFSGQVATFTDANPTAPLGDFSATITWGDGSSSTGSVSINPSGGFQVQGSHTYTKTGTFTFKVTISDQDGAKLTVKGTATVTTGTAHAVAGGPTPVTLAPVNGAASPNQSSPNQSTAVVQGAAVAGSTTAAVGGQSVVPALDKNVSLLDPTQTAAIADRAFVSIADDNDDGTGWFSLG